MKKDITINRLASENYHPFLDFSIKSREKMIVMHISQK